MMDHDSAAPWGFVHAFLHVLRVLFCSSSEVAAFLAEVAARKWKLCKPESRAGIRALKEAIKHQSLHAGMLDHGSAAKKGKAFVVRARSAVGAGWFGRRAALLCADILLLNYFQSFPSRGRQAHVAR